MEVRFSTEQLVDLLVSEKSFGLVDYTQKVIDKTEQLVRAKLPEGYCPSALSLNDISHKATLLASVLKRKWRLSARSKSVLKHKFAKFLS